MKTIIQRGRPTILLQQAVTHPKSISFPWIFPPISLFHSTGTKFYRPLRSFLFCGRCKWQSCPNQEQWIFYRGFFARFFLICGRELRWLHREWATEVSLRVHEQSINAVSGRLKAWTLLALWRSWAVLVAFRQTGIGCTFSRPTIFLSQLRLFCQPEHFRRLSHRRWSITVQLYWPFLGATTHLFKKFIFRQLIFVPRWFSRISIWVSI